MKIDDLIVDIGKQVQVKNDVVDTLKKHAQDPESSSRLAYALIEIGIDAFRHAGFGPFIVMAICQMIAHGATTETALKALMAIHEEDALLDEHDPKRRERNEQIHAKSGKKQRVM